MTDQLGRVIIHEMEHCFSIPYMYQKPQAEKRIEDASKTRAYELASYLRRRGTRFSAVNPC